MRPTLLVTGPLALRDGAMRAGAATAVRASGLTVLRAAGGGDFFVLMVVPLVLGFSAGLVDDWAFIRSAPPGRAAEPLFRAGVTLPFACERAAGRAFLGEGRAEALIGERFFAAMPVP